jgi:hypothetical protein
MLRDFIAVVAGIILSLALTFIGARLTWLLIVGNVNVSEDKDAIVRVFLWQVFLVAPAVSLITGSVVASIVRRPQWWLGGIAILPLYIYGFIGRAHSVEREIFSVVMYIGIAFASAFVVSRFKRLLPP